MIVVGVDGSPGSKAALRWALHEARLQAEPVTALYVWRMPYVNGWGYLPPEMLDRDELQRIATEKVEGVVTDVAGADVTVEAVAREGAAAEVLVEASAAADMLVVGSRGYGGFASLLLGSVGNACAHHAQCPVVIVRGTEVERELAADAKAKEPAGVTS